MALRQLQLHALLLCDVVHNNQHCRLARDGVLQQHTHGWLEHGRCLLCAKRVWSQTPRCTDATTSCSCSELQCKSGLGLAPS